ncbi:hypothetical protein YTPLAS18_30980 [Nitrospira sp.]|nr:hypothetical protein YTPLAS18_30980 [Nitrospira sp.]
MTEATDPLRQIICLLGASGVGKTSLALRFVEDRFDPTYKMTIGMHISKKPTVASDGTKVDLFIRDLEGGRFESNDFPQEFVAGVHGYILVADISRGNTFAVAERVLARLRTQQHSLLLEDSEQGGGMSSAFPPCVLLVNKSDLVPEWTTSALGTEWQNVMSFKTSARSSENVDKAFRWLTDQMVEIDRQQELEKTATENQAQAADQEPSGQELVAQVDTQKEPEVLASEGQEIFDHLLNALDCLVLERLPETRAFRAIHRIPDWASSFVSSLSGGLGFAVNLNRSDFLTQYYLPKAARWWDQSYGNDPPSELWEEWGPGHTRLDLEATAMAIGPRQLLVIKRLSPSVRAYLQHIRVKQLDSGSHG